MPKVRKEIPELEKLVQTGRKKFVRYEEGAKLYSIVNQTLGWRYIFVLLVPVLIITLISIRLCSLQEL